MIRLTVERVSISRYDSYTWGRWTKGRLYVRVLVLSVILEWRAPR